MAPATARPTSVVVNGTNGNDTIDVSGDAGGVKVSGLAATVEVLHPEVANDRLEIDTLAGTDTVDAGGLAAGAIQLFVNGVPSRRASIHGRVRGLRLEAPPLDRKGSGPDDDSAPRVTPDRSLRE